MDLDTFVGLATLIGCAVWLLADRIAAALAWLDRRNAETDACDHEPATAADDGWLCEVDEVWLFADPAFVDATPERAAVVQFAAAVLADIDDLPGVSAS